MISYLDHLQRGERIFVASRFAAKSGRAQFGFCCAEPIRCVPFCTKYGTDTALASHPAFGLGDSGVPSAEYYLGQAEVASRMALIEPNSEKARIMHVLALEYFEKAERARAEQTAPPAYQIPNARRDRDIEK